MVSSACWEIMIISVTEGKVLQGEFRLSQKDSSEIEMTELLIMFMYFFKDSGRKLWGNIREG